MITVSGNSSKTRRFQQQLPPAYLSGDFDFSYDLFLYAPGPDLEFGLKSSDGTIRSNYVLKSGLVYDYSGRFISTYQSGSNFFQYGMTSGTSGFVSYQKFNERVISLGDVFPAYQTKPFDRFYINNSGSENVNFDLYVNGFSPPTIYSDLVGIGNNIFSGNLTQSGWSENPTQGVPYGLLGVSIPSNYGTVNSFDLSGSGIVSYLILGSGLFDSQIINVEFDTLFGKISKPITLSTGTIAAGTSESGLYLSLSGPSNIIQTEGSLEFIIDYYSNNSNSLRLELETSGSYAVAVLSGTGAGLLNYSGFVNKSGLIYSDPFITGTANLVPPINSSYNLEYSLFDTEISISAPATTRTSGVFFTGENTFIISGVPIVGVYEGPFAQYYGYKFSGLGDITITHDFIESEEGVYQIYESGPGYLKTGYSPYFYIDTPSAPIPFALTGLRLDAYNETLFPTGVGYGMVERLVTGEGFVYRQESVPLFLGEGTGLTYTSRIGVNGVGTGDISFEGNVYDWQNSGPPIPTFTPDPPEWVGAYVALTSVSAKGRMDNGLSSVYAEGAPDPAQITWGYPAGPSEIVIQPQNLTFYKDLAIESVVGTRWTSGGLKTLETFGATGRFLGEFSYGGGTFPGPVFPEPSDTGLYSYNGNGYIQSAGSSYYGRGCIFSSGGSDDEVNQFGLFITAEAGAEFEANFNVTGDGSAFGVYTSGITQAFIPIPIIYPAVRSVALDGSEVLLYNEVSLTFQNPDIKKIETGEFVGVGFAPSSDIATKFDMFYKTDPNDIYPALGYSDAGWFTPTKLVSPSDYIYPADFKKGYVKVTYNTTDEDSSDEVVLRVVVGGVTGQVEIITN